MRTFLLVILFFGIWSHSAQGQTPAQRDSLRKELKTLPADTIRVYKLNSLGFQYHLNKPDTTYLLAQQAYDLALKLHYVKGKYISLYTMALASMHLSYYARALKQFNQAKEGFQQLKATYWMITAMNGIANVHMEENKVQKALETYHEVYTTYKTMPNPPPPFHAHILLNIGESLYKLKQLDSAVYYFNLALPHVKKYALDRLWAVYYDLGDVAFAKNNINQARTFYRLSIAASIQDNSYTSLYDAYYRMALLFQKTSQNDSMLHYAKLALSYSQKSENLAGILNVSQFLTTIYEGHNDTEALHYYRIAVAAKDSLYSQDKVRQLLTLSFEEKEKNQQIEAAKTEYKNRIRFYVLIGILAALGALAVFLFCNNRQKQKANTSLHRQKEEINRQRNEIEKTLTELKATQAQLIQSEKLASLGELTAGIAHEIQNPLNFVNNFSEVSAELAQELKKEVEKPESDKTLIIDLANDLASNQEKINHHGQRASAIVKGMLEHSRTGDAMNRVSTDLNALADEYLRLAYHGLRAKDSSFNATMKTHFDPDLPKIEVISQDIGRVLLNLINNAFYAAAEKAKQGIEGYTPTVTLSTKKLENAIEISVKDNGNGIPDAIKDKIFQPFFTTKPTGQGTGLGLSLAYDIVTKGHGGTLEVDREEKIGTAFVVHLPFKTSL
jgi:signal transduction histidine kinase